MKAINKYNYYQGHIANLRQQTYMDPDGYSLSFDEVAKRVLNDNIDRNMEIFGETIAKHEKANSIFYQAIQATREPPPPKAGQIYVDLESGITPAQSIMLKAAYAQCEKQSWEVNAPNGQWISVGSVTEAILSQAAGLQVRCQETKGGIDPAVLGLFSQGSRLRYAPAVLSWTSPSSPTAQVAVKPKVAHMKTFGDLGKLNIGGKIARQTAFIPSEQIKAARTLYAQPLDLHDGNIGFHPVATPYTQEYEEMRFNYGQNQNADLYQMQLDFLQGGLKPDSTITMVKSDGTEQTAPIKDFPNLTNALSASWELDFFDTDINMAEENGLLKNPDYGTVGPVRHNLAQSTFANVPLSDEAIAALKENANKLKNP